MQSPLNAKVTFHINRKIIPKIHLEAQKTLNSQKSRGFIILNFNSSYITIATKAACIGRKTDI
jgi:energy-coupling factor transporter transmembrane protein EcfT